MRSADARQGSGLQGFTLIEMMAVMMITALMASLVLTFIPGTGRSDLKSVVMQTVALLRRERMAAVMTSSDRYVSLDDRRRVFIGQGGDEVAVPKDVAIDILGIDQSWLNGRAVALFHADGGSSGGALKFSRDRIDYEVRVNWYTGAVSIENH